MILIILHYVHTWKYKGYKHLKRFEHYCALTMIKWACFNQAGISQIFGFKKQNKKSVKYFSVFIFNQLTLATINFRL